MLRLYSPLFAGWIGVVFLLFAADLAGLLRSRRWFVGTVLVTALSALMILNFANPEAVVVQMNVGRAQHSQRLDAGYLGELSSDATPVLLAAAGELAPSLRAQVIQGACIGSRTYAPERAAYNASAAQAAGARRQLC